MKMVTDQTTGSGGRIRPAAQAAAGHPPAARTDVPPGWDERTVLTSMLDYARATVHAKCAGITDADARRAPLATSPLTTISGLVSHLRLVEDGWFSGALLAAEYDNPCTGEDPDREMRIAVGIPIARLLAEYESACARNREIVASRDLDTPARRTFSTGETPTLRWILLHLIEETARHNGHIDILREMADGVTGD
jgi:uncharacterized damage-inducible protein DinB